jgi:hypothetical protein
MPDTTLRYEYSFTKEILPGTGSLSERTRYRGRCACGRQTHLIYSTAAAALTAIRRTHNETIESERLQHDRSHS